MSIPEKTQAIVDRFDQYNDWEERYKEIILLGRSLEPLKEEYKKEENRIKGCQSQVWLHAELDDNGCVIYKAESDAMIVRGLAALLISVYSGEKPDDILKDSANFLAEIGLTTHLSQSRSNGLAAMVKQFKNYAIAFKALASL